METYDTNKPFKNWGILPIERTTFNPVQCPHCNSYRIGPKGQEHTDIFLHANKEGKLMWVERKWKRYRCHNPLCAVNTFAPDYYKLNNAKKYTEEVIDLFDKEIRLDKSKRNISEIADSYGISDKVASKIIQERLHRLRVATRSDDFPHLYFVPFFFNQKECMAIIGKYMPECSLMLLDMYEGYYKDCIEYYMKRSKRTKNNIIDVHMQLDPNSLDYFLRLDPTIGLYIPYRFLCDNIKKEKKNCSKKLRKKKSSMLDSLMDITSKTYNSYAEYREMIKGWGEEYYMHDPDYFLYLRDKAKKAIIMRDKTMPYAKQDFQEYLDGYFLVRCTEDFYRNLLYYSKESWNALKNEEEYVEEYQSDYQSIDKFLRIIEEFKSTNISFQLLFYRLLYATKALETNDDPADEAYILQLITNYKEPIDQDRDLWIAVNIDKLYDEIINE